MPADIPKPPYEPEFAAFLDALPPPKDFTPELIPVLRDVQNSVSTLETTLAGEAYTHEERSVPGPHGPVALSIFRPIGIAPLPSGRPGIYYSHSGGMICGNRFTGFKEVLQWGKDVGAVCITAEYRLSPEHPFPVPLDDCYAGLMWIGEHLAELGIDPEYLMLAGQSAGGNIVAAMTVMARDRDGPKIRAQLLDSPMLDDRMETNSSKQFVGEGSWSRGSNVTAWTAYLGDSAGKPDVTALAAPSRITNAANLPPAFICAGSAELFRDESIAYAQKLWAAGVQVDLHIWQGGFHLFDYMVPDHPSSKGSIGTRAAWARRMLAKPVQSKL
ncbi:Alpha/Beta hydrolase protein [Dactylonectria estremocensis]|uniref:Alpha/Beta hydrolase protein n=1 Tax=Dactylonectria estremocensis TaxID=1079267 RepID=A0A9P9J1E0_9HYPO|nr:Alpha/Beta hydrolase protein [Dactylonectria estremocensis]